MSEPSLPAPSGITPDFAHPKDVLRSVLLVTQCLCIPIVSSLVVLRLYVKFRFQQQLGVNECGCFISTTWR
jgi:hypothetical protein